MSTARGHHDQQMDHHRLDNRLATIEETQRSVQNTLHEQAKWQSDMGNAIADIQQNQQQHNEN